jgi:hypothetical protein
MFEFIFAPPYPPAASAKLAFSFGKRQFVRIARPATGEAGLNLQRLSAMLAS